MLKLTATVFLDGTEVPGLDLKDLQRLLANAKAVLDEEIDQLVDVDQRDGRRAAREFISQIHSIKRLVLPSGMVAFDAERTSRGHADRFWAMALVCQKERGQSRKGTAIAVRVIG